MLLRASADARILATRQTRGIGAAAGRRGLMMHEDLTDEERLAIERHIERLREEHRDLDAAIEALRQAGQADQLQVQRLKKRKLQLRDRVSQLEDELTPDIIA